MCCGRNTPSSLIRNMFDSIIIKGVKHRSSLIQFASIPGSPTLLVGCRRLAEVMRNADD